MRMNKNCSVQAGDVPYYRCNKVPRMYGSCSVVDVSASALSILRFLTHAADGAAFELSFLSDTVCQHQNQ